jgi:hypothetical protein
MQKRAGLAKRFEIKVKHRELAQQSGEKDRQVPATYFCVGTHA